MNNIFYGLSKTYLQTNACGLWDGDHKEGFLIMKSQFG